MNGKDVAAFMDLQINNPNPGGPPTPPYCASDFNASGGVDMGDVAMFVNALLGI